MGADSGERESRGRGRSGTSGVRVLWVALSAWSRIGRVARELLLLRLLRLLLLWVVVRHCDSRRGIHGNSDERLWRRVLL